MRIRKLITIALTAISAASVAACATSDGRAPQPAGNPGETTAAEQAKAPAEAQAPAEQAPTEAPKPTEPLKATDLEHSSAEVSAPFVLTLEGPKALPEKGEFEIVARIKAPNELKVPTTITLVLPKGATQKGGDKAQETLATLPAGELTRTYKVTAAGNKEPFRVIVDAKDPAKAMGAHAERLYPAETKTYSRPTNNVPPPPVGRPGAASLPAPTR